MTTIMTKLLTGSIIGILLWDSVAVSTLDSQSRGDGFNSPPWTETSEILVPAAPPAKSVVMSTQTVYCLWEDETAMERTCHPLSYAEAKKMKSLTLHTHSLQASSRNSSLSLPVKCNTLLTRDGDRTKWCRQIPIQLN